MFSVVCTEYSGPAPRCALLFVRSAQVFGRPVHFASSVHSFLLPSAPKFRLRARVPVLAGGPRREVKGTVSRFFTANRRGGGGGEGEAAPKGRLSDSGSRSALAQRERERGRGRGGGEGTRSPC